MSYNIIKWGLNRSETSLTYTKANLLKGYSPMKVLECVKLVLLTPKDDMQGQFTFINVN